MSSRDRTYPDNPDLPRWLKQSDQRVNRIDILHKLAHLVLRPVQFVRDRLPLAEQANGNVLVLHIAHGTTQMPEVGIVTLKRPGLRKQTEAG